MNSIFTRRSIRKFFDKKIETEKLMRILKAGMQAPSAQARQPWEFLVLQGDETKEAISKMSPYAKMAKEAGGIIVVLCNMDKKMQGDDGLWQQDLSACTQNILLQIVEEGLGGVWLGFYPSEKSKILKKYFNLPENIVPFSVIAFGYSEDENRFVDRFDAAKIHFEKY